MLKKVHFPSPLINESLYLKWGLWLLHGSKSWRGCAGGRKEGGAPISFLKGWRWALSISFRSKSCNVPALLIIIFYHGYKLKINCVSQSQRGLKLFPNCYLWINLASISSASWGIIEVGVCVCARMCVSACVCVSLVCGEGIYLHFMHRTVSSQLLFHFSFLFAKDLAGQ